MPSREEPFVNGEIYHVFNRGVNKQDVFVDDIHFLHMLVGMEYYLFQKPDLRLSYYLNSAKSGKLEIKEKLRSHQKLVEVLVYCLMPNHFHLMVRQIVDNGISIYLGNIQNSYTRYFNRKTGRSGPLFTGRFQAVRVEDDFQYLHLPRYIHLNPNTAGIVKRISDLGGYRWSSYPAYLTGLDEFSICDPTEILAVTGGKIGHAKYVREFADFEKEYKRMKKQLIDGGI